MSTKQRLQAVLEMERLRMASGWSPVGGYTSRRRNQHCAHYTFADQSQLKVYGNGDAAWFYRDERGFTDGWQRWRGWHHCYAQGA